MADTPIARARVINVDAGRASRRDCCPWSASSGVSRTPTKQLLDSHDKAVRGLFERYRGRESGATGHGFLATFDAPAQAIRCALAISAASNGLGVKDRIGVHTGEVELTGLELRGVAVHLAARIMNAAGPGEVFVSATARELASGAGIDFDDRGSFELKGFAGARQLFRARGPSS